MKRVTSAMYKRNDRSKGYADVLLKETPSKYQHFQWGERGVTFESSLLVLGYADVYIYSYIENPKKPQFLRVSRKAETH